jgi:hypothetical protein
MTEHETAPEPQEYANDIQQPGDEERPPEETPLANDAELREDERDTPVEGTPAA